MNNLSQISTVEFTQLQISVPALAVGSALPGRRFGIRPLSVVCVPLACAGLTLACQSQCVHVLLGYKQRYKHIK